MAYFTYDDPVFAGTFDAKSYAADETELIRIQFAFGHAQLVKLSHDDVPVSCLSVGPTSMTIAVRKYFHRRVVQQIWWVLVIPAAQAKTFHFDRFVKLENDRVSGLRHQSPEKCLALVGPINCVLFVRFNRRSHFGRRVFVRSKQRQFAKLLVLLTRSLFNWIVTILLGFTILLNESINYLQFLDFAFERRRGTDMLEQRGLVMNPFLGFDLVALLLQRGTKEDYYYED